MEAALSRLERHARRSGTPEHDLVSAVVESIANWDVRPYLELITREEELLNELGNDYVVHLALDLIEIAREENPNEALSEYVETGARLARFCLENELEEWVDHRVPDVIRRMVGGSLPEEPMYHRKHVARLYRRLGRR